LFPNPGVVEKNVNVPFHSALGSAQGAKLFGSRRLQSTWHFPEQIARPNVFAPLELVGFDPVGGYLALSGLEIQLAGAYELVEFPLERIFHIRIPGQRFG
jgi:hypothetical protein